MEAITRETLIAPVYHLELVRDQDISVARSANKTEEAAQVIHALLDRSPVEQHVVLYLDLDDNIIGAEKVGRGTITEVGTFQMEIVRGALVHGVSKIMVAHNHVKFGETKPSQEDINFTMAMVSFCATVGVMMKDHIITTFDSHYSIKEHQMELSEQFLAASAHLAGIDLPPEAIKQIKEQILTRLEKIHANPGAGPKDSVIELDLMGNDFKKPDPSKSNAPGDWTNTLTYQVLAAR